MNLCRCEKGHFYDREKYSVCPHCAGGGAVDDKRTESFTEDNVLTEERSMMPPSGGGLGMGGPLTDRVEAVPPIAPPPITPPPIVPPVAPPITPPMPIPEMAADQVTVPIDELTDAIDGQAVFDGEDDSDDHTIGFYDDIFSQAAAGVSSDSSKSAANPASKPVAHIHTPNVVSTPCVGWLVALGGEHIGASFSLKVGKNFIGRGTNMDVALTNEKSVSRERHAIVIYEPRESIFLVQPGESSNLTYRNNKVVLMPVQLEAYDTITVGDVNLLFMPLCGERFHWGELLEERKKNNNR